MEKQANELGGALIDLRQSAGPDSWTDDLSIQNYISSGKNSSVLPHTRSSAQATKKKSKLSVWAGARFKSGGEIPQSRGHSVSVSAVEKSLIRFKPDHKIRLTL